MPHEIENTKKNILFRKQQSFDKGVKGPDLTVVERLIVSDAWLICHLPPDTGEDEPPCAIVGVLRKGLEQDGLRPDNTDVFEGIEAACY